jgi:hypothetical protein
MYAMHGNRMHGYLRFIYGSTPFRGCGNVTCTKPMVAPVAIHI